MVRRSTAATWSWDSTSVGFRQQEAPVVALILAAGFGTRFDPEHPKQLVSVNEEAIISRAIRAFENNPSVTDIVVAVNPKVRNVIEEMVSQRDFSKVRAFVDGGRERSDSSYACLLELDSTTVPIPPDAKILIQDGVRPFVSQAIIDQCITSLDSFDALSTAVRSTDTVFVTEQSGKGTVIASVPDRNDVYQAQTPQAFRFATVFKAYQLAMEDSGFRATDDAGVVIRYIPQIQVGIVEGSATNMKITTTEDLPLAQLIAQGLDL